MLILFFAKIREDIGHSSETINLPENITTAADLISHLKDLGENYQAAFCNEAAIRVAVNEVHVDLNHPITDRDEVAFFPPMTGG